MLYSIIKGDVSYVNECKKLKVEFKESLEKGLRSFIFSAFGQVPALLP